MRSINVGNMGKFFSMFKSKFNYIGCGVGIEGAILAACGGMLGVSLLFALCACMNWFLAERKYTEETNGVCH